MFRAEHRDAEGFSRTATQHGARKTRPKLIRSAREIVAALDRIDRGVDPDEEDVEALRDAVFERRRRCGRKRLTRGNRQNHDSCAFVTSIRKRLHQPIEDELRCKNLRPNVRTAVA